MRTVGQTDITNLIVAFRNFFENTYEGAEAKCYPRLTWNSNSKVQTPALEGILPETFRGATKFVLLSYYSVGLQFPSRSFNVINNCLASRKLLIGAISTTQVKCQANYRVLFSFI